MAETEKKWTIPWVLILALSALATFVTVFMRMSRGAEDAVPWSVVASAILLASSAFLVTCWMQNGFWGMAAALLVTLHPMRLEWVEGSVQAVTADALGLTILAICLAGMRLACLREFAWLGWLMVTAAGCACLAAAWVRWPETAHAASLLVLVALPLSMLSSLIFYRRGDIGQPSLGNMVCAVFAFLLIHFGALAIAGWWTGDSAFLDVTLPSLASLGSSSRWPLRGFETASLVKWCWPTPFAVLPLAAWGFLSTAWRGLKDWKKGRPPLSWLLTIYLLITLISLMTEDSGEVSIVSSLATLAVLLVVFGVADVLRGIGERMVLAPPEN